MKEDLLKIGNFTVHSYGLCIAIGIIVAYTVAEFRARRRKLDPEACFNIAMCAAIGGLIGAKLMYYIVEIKSIIANPSLLLQVTNGFVVYGGIIGGTLASFIYCKVKKYNFVMWFDLILPEIAIAQGFGRIGCLMAGCCYGAETDSAFHIVFEDSHFAPNHVWLYPTQIMSSVGNILNFVILVFVIAKIFKKTGIVSSFYLIFYSIGRYIVEMFRGDAERGSVGIFSTSQFISFFILAAGILMFVFFIRRPYRDVIAEEAEKYAALLQAKADDDKAEKTEISESDSEEIKEDSEKTE